LGSWVLERNSGRVGGGIYGGQSGKQDGSESTNATERWMVQRRRGQLNKVWFLRVFWVFGEI